ncbi:MAG: hypothetical protein DHS20C02_09120 [Micavibrio sp.]|nr:MAG: hypothetical protein DHS20C02_09120 [Micavibrio sp.]
MTKTLPKDLSSYDFLKAIAIILMVTDHMGHFFYPDETWWRIFGRLCVPIWFFLIGYARTREIPKTIWLGAGVLVLSSLISGQYLFPLNILFGLMAARYAIDGIAKRALRTGETLAGMFFLLFLLSYPSMLAVEYGTMGALFSLFGYIVRNREEAPFRKMPIFLFMVGSVFVYTIGQAVMLATLSWPQFTVLLLGTIFVCMLLSVFQPVTFPRLTKAMTFPVASVFRLLGRHTLLIYVLHLLLFRAVAMYLFPDRFGFLEWSFFTPGTGDYLQSIFF